MAATRVIASAVVSGLLFLGACMPAAPLPLPRDKVAMNKVLSAIILNPAATCEELRQEFDVEYLPIVDNPAELGLAYGEQIVSTRDGTPLRVWHLPTRLDRGLVLLSMGAVGEMECYLFTAQMLVRNGWTVVMWDYRGFGGSLGDPDVSQLAPDLEDVLDWALATTGHSEATLLGISLGSMPSVAVGVARPEAVNAVVVDSPVALGEEVHRIDFVLRDQLEAFLGLIDPSLVSESLIQDLRQPLLVFMAEQDVVTLPRSIELLFQRAAGKKQLIRFDGVGHARAQYVDPAGYAAHLERFLATVWGQAEPLLQPDDGRALIPWNEFLRLFP